MLLILHTLKYLFLMLHIIFVLICDTLKNQQTSIHNSLTVMYLNEVELVNSEFTVETIIYVSNTNFD